MVYKYINEKDTGGTEVTKVQEFSGVQRQGRGRKRGKKKKKRETEAGVICDRVTATRKIYKVAVRLALVCNFTKTEESKLKIGRF